MKNIWKFIIILSISISLLIVLSNPLKFGSTTIPPFGKFLNPFTGFWAQAESGKSGTHSFFTHPGLTDSSEVYFDSRMIPHIFSETHRDMFFVQGYLHAQNRLFQMDLTSRSIMGTLSEILGPATLEKDIFSRKIDFPRAVQSKLHSWKRHPDMMDLIEAYTSGVNYYIDHLSPKNYPIEYKLLNESPQQWSLEKTASITISLSATLNLRMEDLKYSHVLKQLGESNFSHLFPEFPRKHRPIITDSSTYPLPAKENNLSPNAVQDYFDIEFSSEQEPNIGSNNWALRAVLTQDSLPVLANDPHLPLSLPSIWYENHLNSEGINVYGVSVPGMPGIVIGFNDHVAWGLTNASIDVIDAYTIQWKNKDKGEYIIDNQIENARERIENIKVKGNDTHIEKIWDTHWGPIVYSDQTDSTDIAVKWISHYPDTHCDFAMLFGLMKANNLQEYQEAIQNFYIPGQNIIFASDEDSIALTVQGKFPTREDGAGRFARDGSKTTNDWTGFIPQSDLPGFVNPPENYIVSANEWPTYKNYPYYYSGRFDQYRGRTISNLIQNYTSITIKDVENIQNSVYNLKAAELLPVFIKSLPINIQEEPWIQKMANWDYNYIAESPLPILSEFWIEEVITQTFDELTDADKNEIIRPEEWRLNEILLEDPGDPIFDKVSTKNVKENASQILAESWKIALQKFNNLNETSKEWGRYSPLSIDHLLKIPTFSHRNLFTGGNGNTINAITRTNGPSWKMIVQLQGDSTMARVVYPGGQSGNPGSKFYDNFIDTWYEGNYYTVELKNKPEKIKNKIPYTITFTPL